MSKQVRLSEPDKRGNRYVEADGTIVYRASSLGGCPRAFVALAQGMVPMPWPEDFQEILDEGTEYEDVIRERALEKWPKHPLAFGAQVELNLKVMEGIIVRSHVDDLAFDVTADESIAYLREYKKFRKSGWQRFLDQKIEVHANYPWQVSAMMHALRADGYTVECEFIGGRLDKTLKDEDKITDLERFLYPDPPLPLKAIIKKIAGIELLIEQGYDPSEVPCTNLYPCGFFKLHDEKPPEEVVELSNPEHLAAFAEWETQASVVKTAKTMLEAAEAKKKAAHEKLVQLMGNAKKVSNGKVTLTRVRAEYPEKTITRAAYVTDYLKAPNQRKDQLK